jgi:hypothetical protein
MQDILEEVYGDRPGYKAQVRRRPDGLLQIVVLRWVDEIVPGHGVVASFWLEQRTPVSIVDSADSARLVAELMLGEAGTHRGLS